MDIVQFINDRLRDDEAYARLVLSGYADHVPEWECISTGVLATGEELYPLGDGPLAEHIARHDPARVLAEVAAKRELMTYAFYEAALRDAEWGCVHSAEDIRNGRCREERPDGLFILRALVAPYAGHPDFDSEWWPE